MRSELRIRYYRLVLLLLFMGLGTTARAQAVSAIQGKIVDKNTQAILPFSSIQLTTKKGMLGFISNADGSFQLAQNFRGITDTITISRIGYLTKKLQLNQLVDNSLNIIELEPTVLQLPEVTVKAKGVRKPNAYKIVQAAIDNISKNYPSSSYSYIGYYRDYQLKESNYVNLNEAIVEITDQGFDSNDQLFTKTLLLDYVTNKDFEIDPATEIEYDNAKGTKFIPNATISPWGGNELSILRMHDALRNYKVTSYSFVNTFRDDFIRNHYFSITDTVFLDKTPLYHISFESRPYMTKSQFVANGDIYIEMRNFAIHKIKYANYRVEKKDKKLLYDISLEYSRHGAMMFVNYISFNNLFEVRNPDDFKILGIQYDPRSNAIVLELNHTPERGSALNIRNYTFEFRGERLEIERSAIHDNSDQEVYLYLKKNFYKQWKDSGLSTLSIEARVKNVHDLQGRELGEVTYQPVNQFRELFMQKLKPDVTLLADSLYVIKDKPLSKNQIRAISHDSVSYYWMNTPLKK